MDTTALRSAYHRLLEVAADPDLGDAGDGGWNADQVLAHLISVDAAVSAAALAVVAGSRPTFDNRICLDAWNLGRIVAEHSGRTDLVGGVRRQAAVLCDIADQLSDAATAVLVPVLLLSNDTLVLDQPITLGQLINGLADDHVPAHARQLLEARTGSAPAVSGSDDPA
jgi:hypothetical protein